MATPKFVCMFGLFPHFGYYKECCCKQIWVSFCVGVFLFILDRHLRGELLSRSVILLTSEEPPNCCPFYLPTSTSGWHLCSGCFRSTTTQGLIGGKASSKQKNLAPEAQLLRAISPPKPTSSLSSEPPALSLWKDSSFSHLHLNTIWSFVIFPPGVCILSLYSFNGRKTPN